MENLDPQSLLHVVEYHPGWIHVNVSWPRGVRGRAAALFDKANNGRFIGKFARAFVAKTDHHLDVVVVFISRTRQHQSTLPKPSLELLFEPSCSAMVPRGGRSVRQAAAAPR